MRNIRSDIIVAVAAAAATLSGTAAAQPAPARPPQAIPAQAQPTPTIQAAPVAGQQGVVYPGQPITPSTAQAVPNGAMAPMPQPASAMPGAVASGTPIATYPPYQGAPALPALPGAAPGMPPSPAMSPTRMASEDALPTDMAKELRDLKKRIDEVQRVSATSVNPAPKPVSGTVSITQAPGETPIVLRTAVGIPTNIVFTDATGAPWPIEYATPGAEALFDTMAPVAGSSTLQIRPKQTYAFGGVSVTLRGNPVPISISLTSAQKEVDTRLDVRVLKRGPNAQAPIIDRTPGVGAPADAILMSFLDGVPPSDSKELRTSLNGVRAWLAPNGRMYLRTSMPVVSPAWTDSNASPDGMRAYAMPQVPSIMISLDGALTHVSIGE